MLYKEVEESALIGAVVDVLMQLCAPRCAVLGELMNLEGNHV